MSRPALLPFFSMQRLRPPHATPRGFGCTRRTLSKGQECNARAADSPFFTTRAGVGTHLRYLNQKMEHNTDWEENGYSLVENSNFFAIFLEMFLVLSNSMHPTKEVNEIILIIYICISAS